MARTTATVPAVTGLTSPASTLLRTLAYGTKYHWFVRARNLAAQTNSPAWTFTTEPNPVQVVAPNGGQTWTRGTDVSVHYRINTTRAGTAVRMELWRNNQKAFLLGQVTDPASDKTVSVEDLPTTLTAASNYIVRVTSTKMESAGEPQPWDESDGNIQLK